MGFWDDVTSVASDIGNAVESAATSVVHAGEDAVNAVEGAASSAVSSVESFASDAFSVIKTGAEDAVNGVEDAAKAVEHGVEDAADATAGFLKKAAKYVGGELEAVGEGLWNGVKDVADGVYGSLKDVFEGVTEGVGGFFSNLVQGHVGDAFQSLIDGADKAFIQGPQRLWNGMLDGVQDATDGLTHLLGPLGGPVRSVVDRAADVVRTAGNTVFELSRDVFHVATELPLNFANDMYKVGDDLVHGKFEDAAKDFGGAFVHAGARALGFVGDVVMRTLQGAASIALTATYLQPPSRKLTDDEKAMLREVYGDSVDLDSIRIVEGGPLNNAMAAHTVGNTIYLPEGSTGKPLFDKNGNLTDAGSLLVHETGHVWQSQTAGGDYISQSLYNQAKAELNGESRDAAYSYQSDVNAGVPFSQLNPEQQAEYIQEVLGPILTRPGDAEANLAAAHASGELNDQQYAYAEQVLHDILSKQGAA